MRGLIRTFLTLAPMAGVGALALHLWPIGKSPPKEFPRGDALRGAYLARASGCVSCHTDFKGDAVALAGGAPLNTPFGAFVPPNITPHPDAGIGRWTIQDFAKAVRQGISPEGDPYYPVFTYSFYTTFSDQQIADLWEAFRTVPGVAKRAPEHDVGFPFSFRSGLKLWRAGYLDAPKTAALMGTSDAWNQGRQLVEGPAHCAACHTGRNLAGGLKGNENFAGNDNLPGGSKAPSIRADDLVRKGWTVDTLAYALKLGILPSGDAFGGSMAEVVTNGTAFLTDADRIAIATYLLDPEGTGTPKAPAMDSIPMAGVMDHSNMDMTQSN
jgi:mono/diheme cytochrome c family protein